MFPEDEWFNFLKKKGILTYLGERRKKMIREGRWNKILARKKKKKEEGE
jgi:hypothetical protein